MAGRSRQLRAPKLLVSAAYFLLLWNGCKQRDPLVRVYGLPVVTLRAQLVARERKEKYRE